MAGKHADRACRKLDRKLVEYGYGKEYSSGTAQLLDDGGSSI